MKNYFKDALEEGVDYTGVIKAYTEKNGRLLIYVQLDDSEESEELFISSQKIILRKKSPYHRFCEEMGLINGNGVPVFKRLLDMPVVVQLKEIKDGTMFISSMVRNDYDVQDDCEEQALEELSDYYGTIREFEEREGCLCIYVELDEDGYKGELFIYREKVIMKVGSEFYKFCKRMGLLGERKNVVDERLIDMPVIVQLLEDKDGNMFICDLKRADRGEEDEE